MQSQEFILLGQVSGKIDSVLDKQKEQTGHIGQLFNGLEAVRETLAKLPCADHIKKLSEIEDWQSCHNGTNKEIKLEQVKGNISLRNLILAIICTAAFTTGLNIGLNLIFTGKP